MWRSWMPCRSGRAALAVCLLAVCGCAGIQSPRIDPTGESFFVAPPGAAATPAYRAGPILPWNDNDVAVQLFPRTMVAPVGSEVVLVAGVVGSDGYLRTNRRLDWSVAPGTVGQFVAIGRNAFTDLLVGDFTRPRIVDAARAIGSTGRSYVRLDRGTPGVEDDVYVLRGQSWVTLTSPVEGATQVLLTAPDVAVCSARTQAATIYWIDCQWRFPPPAINPAGTKHVLTTTVTRLRSQAPCAGWIVRYQVAGGPSAGFAPHGAQAIDVPVDLTGQASAELVQTQPAPGTNTINIQVIRPASGMGMAMVVGKGSAVKTWTAPQVSVRKTGPATATLESAVAYQIVVSNPGDQPAHDVVLTDRAPEGLAYLRSNPPATLAGSTLEWRLGQLAPGQAQNVEVTFRAQRQGSVTNCAEVSARGGLKGRDSATTTIMASVVDVQVIGPAQAALGSEVTFDVVVTNRSQSPLAKLLIKDRFPSGMEHAAARSPIERDLGDLAPGQSRTVKVTFRVTQPGRLCHTVEVVGPGTVRAAAEGCVNVLAAAAATSPGSPPATAPPAKPAAPPVPEKPLAEKPPAEKLPADAPPRRPPMSLRKTGPASRTVGEIAEFAIDITNTGDLPLVNLKVVDQYDASLRPDKATEGHKFENDSLLWTIPSLAPGRTVRLAVNCRCLAPAARACNRVTVLSGDGLRDEAEACLEIRPPAETAPKVSDPAPAKPDAAVPPDTGPVPKTAPEPPREKAPAAKTGATGAGLTITVSDLRDPVNAGKELTYEIRVTNPSPNSDHQVKLTVTLPEAMAFVPLGTSGPAEYQAQDRTVQFGPVAEIHAGETLTYRVRVRAEKPGTMRLRVEMSSRGQPQPVVQEETTEVVH